MSIGAASASRQVVRPDGSVAKSLEDVTECTTDPAGHVQPIQERILSNPFSVDGLTQRKVTYSLVLVGMSHTDTLYEYSSQSTVSVRQ